MYLGLGELAALTDELERYERQEKADEWREWREAFRAAERAADEEFDRVEAVFRSAMTAAGYWRPNRGRWRRRRGMATAIEGRKAGRKPLTHKEAQALGRRLNDGDDSVRPALKAWLENEGATFQDMLGSPQRWAEDAAIKKWAHGGRLIQVAAPVKSDALYLKLAGLDATPLERLLADRVVFCWFTLYALEWQVASPPEDGRTFRDAEYLDRCVSHADRRFLSAVKTLAVLKRVAADGVNLTLSRTESLTVSAGPPAGAG